jgi:hypothetical protein
VRSLRIKAVCKGLISNTNNLRFEQIKLVASLSSLLGKPLINLETHGLKGGSINSNDVFAGFLRVKFKSLQIIHQNRILIRSE